MNNKEYSIDDRILISHFTAPMVAILLTDIQGKSEDSPTCSQTALFTASYKFLERKPILDIKVTLLFSSIGISNAHFKLVKL